MPRKADVVIREETRIHMEIPYSDGSGVEFGVSLDKQFSSDSFLSVIFKNGGDEAAFPVEKIEWLKSCIERIEKAL